MILRYNIFCIIQHENGSYIHVGHVRLDLLQFLNVVLILANSVDPDEMQHYAAFHLGHHCLQKFPVYKGKCISRRHKQT